MLLHSVCVLLLLAIGATENHLMEEEPRARNKAFECVFGKQIKELGSSWVPDLGVPIGVLYCMKCECVQFQRKRRIIAKVQCRSIKNKCPEPTCEEPVLLPGKCCKTCEGTNNSFEEVQDVVQPIKEEEKIQKHFAALLTGRSSIELKNDDMQPITPSENKNNVVATGRFTLQRKNLYYSFYISDKAARPRALQFLDKAGNILEEHILSGDVYLNSAYQLGTRKVCGIWRRLPKDYRGMVRDGTMYVVLIWGVKEDSEFTLSGQIVYNYALGTEVFSSLLEPAPGTDSLLMAGAGGTAIVSTSSAISPGIHIAIIFNGVFNIGVDMLNVPLNVTLSVEDRKQIVVQERVRISKPAYDLNVLEFRTAVTASDLRQLTRGKLLLSVASVSKPEALKLSGSVITKTTCELFQTTLSSAGSDGKNPYGVSGTAWMYINNEGSLVYNVRVEGLQRMDSRMEGDQTKQLTLFDVSPKRARGGVELEDLTPSFVDGWANGTLEKLGPKVLEPLYSGFLAVNLATATEGALLRGKLQPRLVDEPRNSPAPYLLKRDDSSSVASSAAGIAWLSVAASCHLHYDVSLAGMGGASLSSLDMVVEMFPILYPEAPNVTLLLVEAGEFSNNNVEGSPTEMLTKEELRRLDMGFSFLKVRDARSKKVILSTRVDHLKIPNNCLQTDIDDNTLPHQQPSIIYAESKCLHERRFYNEDAQWTSSSDPCTMCYCQNGQVKCDTFQCPKLTCEPGYVEVERKDECCAVCQLASSAGVSSVPQVCIFGGKTYSVGATFHPFLIPNGFDRCFKCTCDAKSLLVNCTRNSEKLACCYKNNCPATIDRPQMYEVPRPPTEPERNMQILHEGGCPNRIPSKPPHKNGSSYHPILDRLGEYKCVVCKCKDGSQSCHRLKCTHEMCNEMEIAKKNGSAGNGKSASDCCTKKVCKKLRRHHRLNRS